MHAHLRVFCFREIYMMSDKEFKTINEQLNILKSRGLTIDNEEEADDFP